jgi:hypothetical protein
MNRHDIAQRWAKQHVNKRGQCAARARSFFYEGPTIYSWGYHWPIATIRTLDTGEQVVLLHNVRHTSSTNRHTSEAGAAACRKFGRDKVFDVEHDYWSDVTDLASLDHCIMASKEAAAERAEEARIRRNEQVKSNKEYRCRQLRSELELAIDVPMNAFDDTPDATVVKLARMCGIVRGRSRWYLAHCTNKELCDFLSTLFAEQPELLKAPRKLAPILRNYTLLAA